MDLDNTLRKYGNLIKSQINSNLYWRTFNKIYVTNHEGELIKKIYLPKTNDRVKDERICGFKDMYFDGKNMLVIIKMRDYYDSKAILDEKNLELSRLSPYK